MRLLNTSNTKWNIAHLFRALDTDYGVNYIEHILNCLTIPTAPSPFFLTSCKLSKSWSSDSHGQELSGVLPIWLFLIRLLIGAECSLPPQSRLKRDRTSFSIKAKSCIFQITFSNRATDSINSECSASKSDWLFSYRLAGGYRCAHLLTYWQATKTIPPSLSQTVSVFISSAQDGQSWQFLQHQAASPTGFH